MRDNLLSTKEAAEILGVHWQTVRNYIERGELKSHKIGKLVKIQKIDLDNFVQSSKEVTHKIEIELRYQVKSIKHIQKILLDIDATLVQQTHIIDHWFIPINIKNMAEEIEWFDKKRNTGIRIREYINEYGNRISASLETKRMTLAMNHNTFLETSMPVETYEKAKEFLEMIDRKEYLTIDKNRLVYKKDVFEISIDEIKGYGSGIEIEYKGEGDRETVLKEITQFARELNLTEKDRFEKSITVDAMDTLAKF